MDIFNRLLDFIIIEAKIDPILLIFHLGLLGIFVWLTKELRSVQNEETILKQQQSEKAMIALVEILATEDDMSNVFKKIYAGVPSLEYKTSKVLLAVLNDKNISQEEKVHEILSISETELMKMARNSNSMYLTSSTLAEDYENFGRRLWRIFQAPVYSLGIIFFTLVMFGLLSFGENTSLGMLKPAILIITTGLAIFWIDLITYKKLGWISNILFGLIIISGAISVFNLGIVYYIFTFVFVTLLTALFSFAISKKRKQEFLDKV